MIEGVGVRSEERGRERVSSDGKHITGMPLEGCGAIAFAHASITPVALGIKPVAGKPPLPDP
jgi:hypothetical protein